MRFLEHLSCEVEAHEHSPRLVRLRISEKSSSRTGTLRHRRSWTVSEPKGEGVPPYVFLNPKCVGGAMNAQIRAIHDGGYYLGDQRHGRAHIDRQRRA